MLELQAGRISLSLSVSRALNASAAGTSVKQGREGNSRILEDRGLIRNGEHGEAEGDSGTEIKYYHMHSGAELRLHKQIFGVLTSANLMLI